MTHDENTGDNLATSLRGSGRSRLVQTLHGDTPRIETVGILSAANPGGIPLPAAENNRRNEGLRRELVTYGMCQIKGIFGVMVNPFVVANLARADVVTLGRKYTQVRVIFGQRMDVSGSLAMRFELIGVDAIDEDERRGVISERVNFVQPLGSPSSPGPIPEPQSELTVPYFGESPNSVFRGGRVLTYRQDEIPGTSKAQEVLSRLHARDRALLGALAEQKADRGVSARYLYERRGDQNLRLIELHKLMGNWRAFPFLSWENPW